MLTEDVIREEAERADDALLVASERGPADPDRSYEDGVDAALRWVLGDTIDPPITAIKD